MDSHFSSDFRKCHSKLPFVLTLYFKPIDSKNDIWSVHIGDHYRAFGVRDGEEIT